MLITLVGSRDFTFLRVKVLTGMRVGEEQVWGHFNRACRAERKNEISILVHGPMLVLKGDRN